MDIKLQRISYKNLKDGFVSTFNDKYCMISDYLTSNVRNTLLANPNLSDDTKSALNLVICDKNIVGRNMLMPTKIKANDEVLIVQTGGSYEIADEMRGKGLGTLTFEDSIFKSEYDTYIGQLYSTTAIAIVKKLGLIIFELPMFFKLCKSRSFLEAKGITGFALKIGSAVCDALIRFFDCRNTIKLMKIKKHYQIQKESSVPEWVDEITLCDGYSFYEIHDRNWLQWCLDNKFTENSNDQQLFYSIYDMQHNPKGFFMTKERFEDNQGRYKNITRGTIVEWGSYNEEVLDEIDINLLAIDSFGHRVDNITTVLSDTSLIKKMKLLGFIRHGEFHMSIKPGHLDVDGIDDQRKWRIRYGGCNTVIY